MRARETERGITERYKDIEVKDAESEEERGKMCRLTVRDGA